MPTKSYLLISLAGAMLLLTGCPDDRAAEEPLPRRPSAEQISRYAEALRLVDGTEHDTLAVFYTQVLLDRAFFSPGEIDGVWGPNTVKAIYWLQHQEGNDQTGRLNWSTLERLLYRAQAPQDPRRLVRLHRLSEEDVEGPFTPIPRDVYEQAEMDYLGYESLAEKLGEMFHISPALLSQINGRRDLNALAPGDTIRVPANRSYARRERVEIERLVVSDAGRYLHALDAGGNIVYHFPATLGDEVQPSPRETLEIESVTREPWWHYQPAILAHVDDEDDDALIPPGPNNAVGLVWINLTKQHFGIHGTNAPGTIGYATSAGCVRLTNWDALFLADRVREGMEVEFRDVDARRGI
jgi:lipoprotein-anchoring transpeptidase ErfK/SrfK